MKQVKNIINKISWFFSELINIYSNKSTFFSKKRIESGVAFIIAEWGMVYFLQSKHSVMSMTDFGIWAAMQFCVAGYMVNQIQKEKILDSKSEDAKSDDTTNTDQQ